MTAAPDVKARIERIFVQDFRIIATSEAVSEMIEQCGGNVRGKICCGFDDVGFTMQILPEHRPNLTLGFPVRGESFKGLDDAIQAAEILRRHYGNIFVSAHSEPTKPPYRTG